MKGLWQRRAAWLQFGLGLALGACAQAEDPDSNLGSETHWLTLCNSNAECGSEGLTCECGVCSLPCSEDAMCAGYDATCRAASDKATTALCGESVRSVGICLPECGEGCSAGQSCVEGACVPTAAVTPLPATPIVDAGTEPPAPPTEPDVVPTVVPMPSGSAVDRPDAGGATGSAMADASVGGELDASSGVPTLLDAGMSFDAGTALDASITFLDAGDPGVDSGIVIDGSSSDAGMSGVVLRAIVTEVSPGNPGIAAEWTNGTLDPIYLAGCSTVSGWSFDGAEWQEYGGFVVCTVEAPMVAVAPGETYQDVAGVPPDRELDIWRLVGTYGTGCVPTDGLFSEVTCTSRSELTSNEVTLAR